MAARRLSVWAVLLGLLTLCTSRPCPAQPAGGPDDGGGSGFRLVSQALRARLHLVYTARQDIFWMTPTATGPGVAQVVADIARDGRRTRILYRVPSETAGRVMLDDGSRSSLFDPARRALLIGQSAADDLLAASPTTLTLLRRNYCCTRMRQEILNGCLCDVVTIQPRLGPGPSKRLWIDAGRHAILRTEEYDAENCRRYVSFYESIFFPPRLPPGALDLPPAAHDPRTQRVDVSSVDKPSAPQAFAAAHLDGRSPAWCPQGYALTHCTVIGPPAASRSVLLHYSDGLKSLVVLEESRAGRHPTAAELNEALARYGQQAWVHEEGRLRTLVRGDLSLPDALGAEMVRALCPDSDRALAQGLTRDFGAVAAKRGAVLRQAGWGYEQIAALLLGEKKRPGLRPRLKPLLDQGVSWPRIAALFGAGAADLQGRSRGWVAATLAGAH